MMRRGSGSNTLRGLGSCAGLGLARAWVLRGLGSCAGLGLASTDGAATGWRGGQDGCTRSARGARVVGDGGQRYARGTPRQPTLWMTALQWPRPGQTLTYWALRERAVRSRVLREGGL